jgi:RNA polymerase-binding transcription factor DksA
MTAAFEVSHRTERRFPTSQAGTFRALLIAGMRKQSVQFARHAAALSELISDASRDPSGRDRAMAALRLFGARAAIEEIEDALVRIDGGRYGECQSCDQPIPLEHLQVVPQARTCATCPRPVTSSTGGPAASRRGPACGEHAGPSRVRGVLTALSTDFVSRVEGGT